MSRSRPSFAPHSRLAAALLLLGSAGCVGKGSEVGPQLPDFPEATRAGVVLDPGGRPVSNARVTIGGDSGFTDARGRFLIPNNTPGTALVEVDARLTTTVAPVPGIFDRIAVAGAFAPSGKSTFPRPIFLPNFADGASQAISVNQGNALAGTLADPATGAELVLTGAVATIPGSPATTATIRFVSIPPTAISAPLEPGGVIRAGALYFAIAPAELVFTVPPLVRIGDATFGIAAAISHGKVVSPELDRLDPATGAWVPFGAASIGGGFLSSGACAAGGLYSLSVDLPPSNQTIVTARIVDREIEPLERALAIARDGRGSKGDPDGALAIPEVCAADADGVPLPVSLTLVAPVFAAQQAIATATLPGNPGVGLTTDFQDRPLPTVPAGRLRILCVYRGDALAGCQVGAAAAYSGNYSARGLSTATGVEFPDMPEGTFAASAGQVLNSQSSIRAAANGHMGKGGQIRNLTLYLSRFDLRAGKHEGTFKIQTFRGGSGSVLFGAYGLLGIDPSVPQQSMTDSSTMSLHPIKKGAQLTTVAKQFEVPGFGSPIDVYRKVGFVSQYSETALRRPKLDADLDLMPAGFDPAGEASGAAGGLTDPGVVPPVNGNYSVEVRARRAAPFEDRIAAAMGAEADELTFLPDTALAPTFAIPTYRTLVPAGTSALALVERDAAAPASKLGPIRKLGFIGALDAPFGALAAADVFVDQLPSGALDATVAGAIPPSFRVGLVMGFADGGGLDVGDQESFTYDSGTQALHVEIFAGVGPAAAAILTGTGLTPNQSAFATAAAAILGDPSPAQFLAVPEVTAPPPVPGDVIALSPTGAGIEWAQDPAAQETLLRVTREATTTGGDGKKTKETRTWTLRLPTPITFPFVFPTTPPNLNDKPVPNFFESGGVYTLSIETRRYVTYDERTAATSGDILPASFFQLRALARTETLFKIP